MRPHLRLVILLCQACVGCASLDVRKPTASVTGMSLRDVTAQGFTMDFAVAVHNPNAVSLPLAGAEYALGVGGSQLLDGKAAPEGSVPAHGSAPVKLPVTVTFEHLLSAEQAIRDTGGDVPYDLSGALTFDTGNPRTGTLRVPVRYAGTLPLKRVLSDPEALLKSPAAKRLAAALVGRWLGK